MSPPWVPPPAGQGRPLRRLAVDGKRLARMISLGLGPHMCLGQHLARLEFRIVLRTLLKLAPNYEVAEEGPKLPPNFGASMAFTEVPLRFN